MKQLLLQQADLYIENNEEELKVLTCDHEEGYVIELYWPTSPEEDIEEFEVEGCPKCERPEWEIEEIQMKTIGHLL